MKFLNKPKNKPIVKSSTLTQDQRSGNIVFITPCHHQTSITLEIC